MALALYITLDDLIPEFLENPSDFLGLSAALADNQEGEIDDFALQFVAAQNGSSEHLKVSAFFRRLADMLDEVAVDGVAS